MSAQVAITEVEISKNGTALANEFSAVESNGTEVDNKQSSSGLSVEDEAVIHRLTR
jgi:hypothetical protein